MLTTEQVQRHGGFWKRVVSRKLKAKYYQRRIISTVGAHSDKQSDHSKHTGAWFQLEVSFKVQVWLLALLFKFY